jgi:cytochrome oxidase Cu insertion factor (SCO1/SenC/PrrC family)
MDRLFENGQTNSINSRNSPDYDDDCETHPYTIKLRWLLEAVLLIVIIALIAVKCKAPSCMKQWPQYGDYLKAYNYGDPVDFTKLSKKNYNSNADILSPIGM